MDPFQKIDDGRTDGQSVGRTADGLMLANSMVTLALLAERERETETTRPLDVFNAFPLKSKVILELMLRSCIACGVAAPPESDGCGM